MKIPRIKLNFKKKRTWIILVVILIIAFSVISSVFFTKKGTQYETVKAERGTLVQTVDATGKIESSNDLSLHFEGMGIVDNVKVKEGDSVKAGQLLANLSLSELNAAVSQAQASLNQKLAGATPEQIEVSQKQIDSATIALTKAEDTLKDTSVLAEKNLAAKYSYALNVVDDSYIKVYNSYTVVDNIQKTYFTSLDTEGLAVRNAQEYNIKRPRDEIKSYLDIARASGKNEDVDKAISSAVSGLNKALEGLTSVRDACDGNAYKNTVTATEKTSLDTQKSYISTAQTTASGVENDISILKTQNENNINAAKAAVDTARASLALQQANYNSLVARPRDVDIAYYQSVLDQAVANRGKAIIIAPIDGIVTKVSKKKGELITSAETMIEMLSPHYEIKVCVPETDVVKVKTDDQVEVTLDALGNDDKLTGKVLNIDPASTEIQGVVYYKIKVGLDEIDNSKIKSGMTADVLIKTETKDDVMILPSRAVMTRTGTEEKYVRVLKDGVIEERDVELGLKGDEGKVEIISGLEGGEEIVLRIGK